MRVGEMSMLLLYILGVNLISFVLMGIDKRKAEKKKFRIPERTFWIVSLLGGALGSLIGMNYFRHKTKHTSFKVGIPLLLLVNIGLIFLAFSWA